MICPKCGTELPDGARFCMGCGTTLAKPQPKCPKCGKENPEYAKFCLACGAPIAAATVAMTQVPTAAKAAPPSPPAVGAEPFPEPTPAAKPKPKLKDRKGLIIAIAVIAGLLVVGGAVAGIIAWRVSVGNRLVAEIESVELERTDGGNLELNQLPLDTNMVVKVSFRARYKEGGKATLTITNSAAVTEGEQSTYTYDVKSSDGVQEKTSEPFYLKSGTGQQERITAKLEVAKDDKEASDSDDLTYTTVAGQGLEMRLEEARAAAEAKAEEANRVMERAIGLGINVDDLLQRMLDAAGRVEANPTEEELNNLIATLDGVIQEGNQRIAAAEQAQQQQQAGQDEAACKQAMLNFAENNWLPERAWIDSFSWNNSQHTSATGVIGCVGGDGSTAYTTVYATKSGGSWSVSGPVD